MRTLLLADDSVTVQRVIALTFAEEPIQVITVADGQQAMERMAAQKPDIVLAGTTLPHVSGYDLARFIRNKPELKDVPVLLLSGAFESVDEARLVSSGANGVLEKPVEPSVVIGRVKELLGLKAESKPSTAGRLVAPADGPAVKKLPVPTPPRAVTSTRGTPSRWEQLRNQTGLEPDTRSVEDSSTRSDDYLDTLDAAFDSLDQQLSGRTPTKPQRNPSGPLGQSGGASDPRSPGRRPAAGGSQPGNPVFEVDDEWFGAGESEVREGRRDIAEDLRDPELSLQTPAKTSDPIYEVDDEWFADGDKVRAEKMVVQQHLAVEMGIHDVELPEAARPTEIPAPSKEDFDFGLDDLKRLVAESPAEAAAAPAPVVAALTPTPPQPAPPPAAIAPLPTVPKVTPPAPAAPAVVAPPAAPPAAVTPVAPVTPASTPVADDFAALLAFEQGERKHPPMPPPPEIKVVAPEVTAGMLEEIAARVAERLTAGTFGAELKDAMTSTMRQTVRDVVSAAVRPIVTETSERIVREVVVETAERVVRQGVAQHSERVVRDVAAQALDRVVPGVTQAAERLVRDAVGPITDRVVREAVAQTAEHAVREAASQATEGVAREVVLEASERLVREEIERIKSRSKS